MKAHWIGTSAVALVIIGAGVALTSKAPGTAALSFPAGQSVDPEALAKKSGCFECHSVDQKIVGPAYRDVAERYKDNAKARAALIEKISKGGKGNWTEVTKGVPMPSHSGRLSAADTARLVDWVLSLVKRKTNRSSL